VTGPGSGPAPGLPSGLTLRLAQQPAADALLATDPFALLTGMMLDQQIPMEKAFSGPRVIADRMGTATLDPRAVAELAQQQFEAVMAGPPAVHRYHRSMAGRVQELARHVCEHYDADAAAIWRDVRSAEALKTRLVALPGYGEQKAKIFIALLGKQVGIRPRGWRGAAGGYGERGSFRSVADVVDQASLQKVRDYKKAIKAGAGPSPGPGPASGVTSG
jgi:uncharacterized HhH-GPD family protein